MNYNLSFICRIEWIVYGTDAMGMRKTHMEKIKQNKQFIEIDDDDVELIIYAIAV